MLRFVKYSFIFLITLIVTAWLLLQSTTIQKKVILALENTVFESTGLHVTLDQFHLDFPNKISTEGLLIEDENHTLVLASKKALIDVNFFEILKGDFPKFYVSLEDTILHSLPEFKSTSDAEKKFTLPEIYLTISTLEITPALIENFISDKTLQIDSAILEKMHLQFIKDELEAYGTTHASGVFQNHSWNIDTDFILAKDKTLQIDFKNIIDQFIPLTGTFKLSSKLTIEGTSLHLTKFDLVTLQHLFEFDFNGIINADFTFSGSLYSPLVEGKIDAETLVIQGAELKNTHSEITSKINNRIITGALNLESLINGEPLQINTELNWPFNAPLNFTAINLKSSGGNLEGALTISPSESWIEGQMTGALKNLSFLGLRINIENFEPITFKLDIPRAQDQPIETTLIFSALTLGDVNVENGTLEIIIKDLMTFPYIHLNLITKKVYYKDLEAAELVLKTSITKNNELQPFDIYLEGKWSHAPIKLNIEGGWFTNQSGWQIAFDAVQGKVSTFPFHLTDAVKVTRHKENFTVTPVVLAVAEGFLKSSVTLDPQTVEVFLNIEDIPLSSFPSRLMDFPLKGNLHVNASITGSPSDPKTEINISANQLLFEDKAFAKIKPSTGAITIKHENHFFSAKGSLTTPDYPPVNIDLEFPVIFALNPFVFKIEDQAQLSGRIEAEGEVAPILQRLLDNPTSFSGRANGVINLAGTYETPKFSGLIHINHGSYEIPEIGILLQDLQATLEANSNELIFKHIEASDGKGGRLIGTGHYLIDKTQHNPFILELNLNEATFLNQDYVQIVGNGPLTFKGNNERGSIVSQLQVSKALITIPERSSNTINTVDVKFVNAPENAPKPQSLTIQEASWPLSLDLKLTIPKTLQIQGRDLSSNWKGELNLQGTAKIPLLYGELKITDGQYLFNGNPFTLSQGTITFAGELDKKTTMYVIAHKDLDKVKVDVIAKGAIKNPEISFRSNPPLSQREILSWILFNRGPSEISPFQGAQLSESITNLSTNQQGPDVLSKIRSTLKIDRFEIGRSGNGDSNDVNVQVGKYISDNVLISVIKSDVNKVAVEANITENIKFQAHVGDDSQGQLFLKWKKDY